MVGHAVPLEVVKTVVEIAEVAWTALEHRRESKHVVAGEEEISQLRAENLRLREILEENLRILLKTIQNRSLSEVDGDCPPDIYECLEAVVDSSGFLSKLDSLNQESNAVTNVRYPSIEAKDLKGIDFSVGAQNWEPGQWAWVTEDMLPEELEEASGLDGENYVLVSEENVVDGIAEFIAKCIHENPKSKDLKPEELRRMVTGVLGGVRDKSKLKYVWEAGKIVYALSSLGICIAGLYQGRAVVKAAALGVHAASKVVVRAL